MFKLGPPPNTANIASAEANLSSNPPPPVPGPASDIRPSSQELGTTPAYTMPRNVRLENAQAAIKKKRKPDDKSESALNKKQKFSTATLAIPSDGNTIK